MLSIVTPQAIAFITQVHNTSLWPHADGIYLADCDRVVKNGLGPLWDPYLPVCPLRVCQLSEVIHADCPGCKETNVYTTLPTLDYPTMCKICSLRFGILIQKKAVIRKLAPYLSPMNYLRKLHEDGRMQL